MKNTVKAEIKDYLLITIGVTIYSIAVAFFFLPYKLTSGGVAGIGSLIFYATGFEVQNSYFIINAALLVVAVIKLGWKFLVKTIYGIITITIMLWLTQRIFELMGSPLLVGDELFMACLIGAILEGVGLAICFLSGGSTGGTDIIAAIVNRYRNVSLGTVLMLCDVVIVSSCFFVFHDIQRVVFGYVYLIVASISLDYFVSHQRQAVEFKIYSRNPMMIADAIVNTGRGVTLLDGMGYFTKSDRKVVVSVVRKREQYDMFRMIKAIDPYAFVTMGNVSGVWGEGFDSIKVRDGKNGMYKKVLVATTNSMDEVNEIQHLFGEKYEVRSLNGIACDINNPINGESLYVHTEKLASHVKVYFGFDAIAIEKNKDTNDVKIYVSTGANMDECVINSFNSLDEAKSFLDKEGTKNV